MTEKTDKKRDAPVSYRPPAELRDEFRRRVKASGLPVNAYITKALFDLATPRRAPAVRPSKNKCSRNCSPAPPRSATLWTHAARVAGDESRAADALQAACDELTVIRAALLKMMERAP